MNACLPDSFQIPISHRSVRASDMFQALLLRVNHVHRPPFSRRICLLDTTNDFVDMSSTAHVLIPKDYPKSFRGLKPGTKPYAHPEDYKSDNAPVKPEAFLYKSGDGRNRVFFRVSFRTSADDDKNVKYTAATFLLDTGGFHDLQVCEELSQALKHRVRKDSFYDYIEVQIDEVHTCSIYSDLPPERPPANVMGLPFFFALGLQFRAGRFHSMVGDSEGIVRDVVSWTKNISHL